MEHKFTEKYIFAYIMATVGGLLGGYSYSIRGGVFASAQTGNLIQLGLKLTQGEYSAWYRHILPITMFSVGIMVCEFMKVEVAEKRIFHWKQVVLTIEGILILLVAFIPLGGYDIYANMLIGFIAGMQTQLVRVVEGTVLMTTMLTGNARTMSELLYHAIRERCGTKMVTVIKQLGVMLCFISGVIIGGIATDRFGQYGIIFALIFILIGKYMMSRNGDNA